MHFKIKFIKFISTFIKNIFDFSLSFMMQKKKSFSKIRQIRQGFEKP